MEQKLFKLKKMDGSKGEGTAIIAELNTIDHDGDITIEGAFGEQHVNLLGAHEFHSPRLGKAVLKEEGNFAVADFKFNLDDDAVRAKEWYSALKFDLDNGEPLQEWSYGYDVIDSEEGIVDGKKVRYLKSLKVHEVSPVIRGAGIGTGTLELKSSANMTFKEEMDRALILLIDVKAFINRAESLAELRAKEGRKLSAANTQGLLTFKTLLTELESGISDLVESDESYDLDRLRLAYQRIVFENKKHLK